MLIACVAAVALLGACGPWGEFRHGADRTGFDTDQAQLGPGAATRLVRRWTRAAGGAVDSSPAISAGGVVAVGAADGNLHAYDHVTGATAWTASTDGAVPSSPAWSDSGTVYLGASNGVVYAFNGANGSRVWTASTGGAVSSPALGGPDVYVGSGDGKVYAMNAGNGALHWSTPTGGAVKSSPAVANFVFVGSDDTKLYALDPSTGALKWSAATGGPVESTPAVANGVVYVGSNDGKVYAFNATSGAQLWASPTGSVVDSSPAVDNGSVYVAGEDGILRALDPATGVPKWTSGLGSGAFSSPAVADGVVYVGTRAGLVKALNAVNGASIWSDTTGGTVLSSPAEQDGIVYVGSGDGTVYAYATTDPCNPVVNKIACENSKQGTPQVVWDVPNGAGSPAIQGFATDISVNVGATVHFKVSTPASAYHADIYRIGYYGGAGARQVATIRPSVPLPQNQPPCLTDSTVNLVDCGNWAESASWTVPPDAVSGVYFARLSRDDGTGGASLIVFVVRDDSSHSDVLFQTSDATWTAYNSYGGEGIYTIDPNNGRRAYKASYNRPLDNRGTITARNQFFATEYPMVRFLEANGYDVTYASGIDSDRFGSHLLNHKVFASVGHDEYWSAAQRTNVEAARAAGVHLAFFSGDEVYWKSRWEPSTDLSATPYRTLVVYKETLDNAKIDPSPIWTGLWRDHRFSPPSDGGRPENALSGTSYRGDPQSCCSSFPLTVSADEGALRLWRNTSLATLAPGTSVTFGDRLVGYEFDEDFDNRYRPAGEIDLSTTVIGAGNATASSPTRPPGSTPPGDVVVPTARPGGAAPAAGGESGVHHLTLYRTSSGALVFSAGSHQWSFGLDGHTDGGSATDVRVQQATVNLLADMGTQPYTLQGGLVPADASTDTAPPTSTITAPAPGASFTAGTAVTVTGTATDSGGGRVGGVEVSADGGQTWHPAAGRNQWSYTFVANTASGSLTIKSRAADDSGNIESPGPGVTVTITPRPCPCTIFGNATPTTADSGSGTPVEVGMKFRTDSPGTISGIRFYKSSSNIGPHTVNLWTANGTLLASAISGTETASGWQQVNFATPVAVTAGTLYIASYHTTTGHVADDKWYTTLAPEFFQPTGVDNTPLHLADPLGPDGPSLFTNGTTSTFPTQASLDENYWIDVTFAP